MRIGTAVVSLVFLTLALPWACNKMAVAPMAALTAFTPTPDPPGVPPVPSPSPTRTFTVTAMATTTSTDTPTASFTFTSSFSPTATFTATRTPTVTFTATFTPSPTPTYTVTSTRTFTPTSTATLTSTFTATPTPTVTATFTPTATATTTFTNTPTACQTTLAVGNSTINNSGAIQQSEEAFYIYANKVTVPGSGTIQARDIWLYIYQTNNRMPTTIYGGLYTDSGGEPQSLISSTRNVVPQLTVFKAPLTSLSGTPLYLSAGANYWVVVAPTLAAVIMGYNNTGTTPYYQGSSTGNLLALPAVLGAAPATYVNSISNLTMAVQLEYCQ